MTSTSLKCAIADTAIAMTTITGLRAHDIRFPTRSLEGFDATNERAALQRFAFPHRPERAA